MKIYTFDFKNQKTSLPSPCYKAVKKLMLKTEPWLADDLRWMMVTGWLNTQWTLVTAVWCSQWWPWRLLCFTIIVSHAEGKLHSLVYILYNTAVYFFITWALSRYCNTCCQFLFLVHAFLNFCLKFQFTLIQKRLCTQKLQT